VSVGAVVAPGYGGTPEQPIVQAMVARLGADGIRTEAVTYSRAKPTEPFTQELEDVRRTRDRLDAQNAVLIGRSFGGRVCTRLAAVERPYALILLGHPIAPRGRSRPEDEQALLTVTCKTLIVQGDRDALGPLDVLQRIAAVNHAIELYVLKGIGHNFGRRTTEGVDHAAHWLQALTGAKS
jgi:predicted alpha/beta-hydrolase family hydrolase